MVQTPFDAQNATQNHRLSELILKLQPEVAFLALAVPIFLWISWSSLYFQFPTTGYWRDIWEHAAAIKEWMKNLWHPGNPHLPIDITSPRYMPYFFVLVLLGKAFNLTALQALGIGGIINIAMLLAGIFLFTREYFNNRWAPVVGLMVFLGGWGMGWVYTSNYQLRSLFYVISYPSLFATGLTFITLWLATRILRRNTGSIGELILLAIMVTVLFVSHPLTGAFAAAILCMLAFFEFSSALNLRVKIIVSVLIGMLAVEAWPYFSVWGLLLHTSPTTWSPSAAVSQSSWILQAFDSLQPSVEEFHAPKVLLITMGAALFAIPVLVYLALKRKEHFIVVGWFLMAVPFFSSIYIKIPLGQRFIYYMIFFMHLSLIYAVLKSGPYWRNLLIASPKDKSRSKVIVLSTGILIGLSFGWNVLLAGAMFAGYHPRLNIDRPHELQPLIRYGFLHPVVEDTTNIAHSIPDDAVVLALPWHAWPLPTFKGKVTVLLNPNPFVIDGGRRYSDAMRFFEENLSQTERFEITRRYNVTHILYRSDSRKIPKERIAAIREMGRVTGRVKAYEIIELPAYSQ